MTYIVHFISFANEILPFCLLVNSKSPDNLRMAKKLSNKNRSIDDMGVCNVNNINDFMICSKDIYPNSIPLYCWMYREL